MSLSDIAEYIFTDASPDGKRKTIRWLQARGLLATQMSCTCAGNMYLVERDLRRGNQDDKWAWRCPECTSTRSIRSGSWFEGEFNSLRLAIYMSYRHASLNHDP